jgi:hypothetical protein
MSDNQLFDTDVRRRWIAHGLNCKVLMGPVGSLNGYVAVGPKHPLFGKEYSWSYCGHEGCYQHTLSGKIEVHGGLTYSGGQKDEKLWWFGFDTAHSDDDPRFGGWTKDQKFVEQECMQLAKQLKEWKTPRPKAQRRPHSR